MVMIVAHVGHSRTCGAPNVTADAIAHLLADGCGDAPFDHVVIGVLNALDMGLSTLLRKWSPGLAGLRRKGVSMDRVLVAYARASGSTGVVGLAIGEQLSRAGFQVDVRPIFRAQEPSCYRAVILGSTLHEGRWEQSAVNYATQHRVALAEGPTWLYQLADSSQPQMEGTSADVAFGLGTDEPMTFDLNLVSADGNLMRRLAQGRRRPDELREWRRVRVWGLLLANELPALAPV